MRSIDGSLEDIELVARKLAEEKCADSENVWIPWSLRRKLADAISGVETSKAVPFSVSTSRGSERRYLPVHSRTIGLAGKHLHATIR